MIKRLALSSLNGINATVFMYGQTGSGKTYTMLGRERKEIMDSLMRVEDELGVAMGYLSGEQQEQNREQPGLLIYALQDIFQEMRSDKRSKTYCLRCSYVEIYNEQVFDLLRNAEQINEALQLSEDKNKDFYMRGVIEEPVSSIEEVLYFLRRGELNRHYAETHLNHSSSRSHTLFRLQVQSITNNLLNEQEAVKYVTQSVLNFVDLAGSERVSSHYENKQPEELYVTDFWEQNPRIDAKVRSRIKEGQNINKSLFFLTQVISMRAENKPH